MATAADWSTLRIRSPFKPQSSPAENQQRIVPQPITCTGASGPLPNDSSSRTVPIPPPDAIPRELIRREKWLMQKEWTRQAIYIRFFLIGLCLTMGAMDAVFDVLPSSWQLFVGLNLVALAANLAAAWRYRCDAVRPWHMWALLGLDTLIIAILTTAVGREGYLGIPFFLLASVLYSFNIPRAARVQLCLALVCYPIARAVGSHRELGDAPEILIAVEELVLAVIGYLAIAGPMRYTCRVRSARRALGALARGDFGIRLPARAMDDLGFLAVSFNDTAERLGRLVRELEQENVSRARIEEALRTSQDALTRQAFHDPLTGLANRARFRERLASALDESVRDRCAVMAIDLDGFKSVNDTFGHAGGDGVLKEVAARLLSATRGSDLVARLGGDEFAVLLRFLHDDVEAVRVAERVLTAIDAPIVLGDRTTGIGVCIGIAHYAGRTRGQTGEHRTGEGDAPSPAMLDAVDAIIHDADVALYHAKTNGKGRWATFDPSMRDAADERRELQADLRLAMTNGELALAYQPIVDLASRQVHRVEALLRWTHPWRGSIQPGAFVPLAEESGLIIPLGRWVLETACRQLAMWCRDGVCELAGDAFSLSINVSGRQLQHTGFVADVARVLSETGVDPQAIVFELTESAVIHQPEVAREQMAALKQAGVRLAIDDFGTGYSSLSYLQHYPIDVLKIDKSFVKDVAGGGAQEALVRTIVGLGKALSLETVGEGIESEEQCACLLAMGCESGQGYLFSRPMTPDALEALLRDRARDGAMV